MRLASKSELPRFASSPLYPLTGVKSEAWPQRVIFLRSAASCQKGSHLKAEGPEGNTFEQSGGSF